MVYDESFGRFVKSQRCKPRVRRPRAVFVAKRRRVLPSASGSKGFGLQAAGVVLSIVIARADSIIIGSAHFRFQPRFSLPALPPPLIRDLFGNRQGPVGLPHPCLNITYTSKAPSHKTSVLELNTDISSILLTWDGPVYCSE